MAALRKLLHCGSFPAFAQGVAVVSPPSLRRGTVAGIAGALLCLLALLGPAREADSLPKFLQEALGPPQADAPLLHHPADGVRVAVRSDRFSVVRGADSVSLAAVGMGNGEWKSFQSGATRTTPFGAETVVVDREKAEQYLTVKGRQGERTWRWQLRAGGLTPRLGDDGTVGFLRGHRLVDTSIAPVAIFDELGSDVTPEGLGWRLRKQASAWWLELRLNDSALPLPYVIDPAITFQSASPGTNGLGATTITLNAPAGIAQGDVLVAQISARFTAAPTAPAGWQLVANQAAGSGAGAVIQSIFWKAAGGAEPASYSWTWGTSIRASGGILAYSGVDGTNPIDVSSGASGSNNLPTAPSVTTTANDAVLVALFGMNTTIATTFTEPADMTERYEVQGTGVASESADGPQPLAGPSGPKTAVSLTSGEWTAQLVALRVDSTPPSAPVQSLSESSVDSFVNGSAFYYRPNGGLGGATFTVSSTPSDAESGVQKVTFPGLAGSMTPTTATDDTTSPYSQTYSWSFGATESGAKTVTAFDNAGNSSTGQFTIVRDAAGPTGHSVTFSGGPVFTTPSVPLVLSSGTDNGGSGVDPSFNSLGRASAPLVGGACGSFSGTWFGIALTGGADTSVRAGNCYRYRYMVRDNVGNNSAWSTPSTDAVVVNSGVGFHAGSSGGTVGTSLTLNKPTGIVVNDLLLAQVTVRSTSVTITEPSGWTLVRRDNAGGGSNQLGQAIYYKFAGPSEPASYTWTFSGSIDASGGIVAAPGVSPTSPIDVSGGLGGSGTSVTAPSITTTANEDGLVAFFGVGASTAYTPPAGMSERYDAGGGQTSVSAADGSQAAAGATGVRTATAISAGSSDTNIGQLVALRKDAIAPTSPTLSLTESAADAFTSGSTLYYRPAGSGSFTLSASASDAESGLQAIVLPGLSAGFTPTIDAASTSRIYSWTSGASEAGAKTVRAYDNAGNTATATFSLVPDSTAPSEGSVSYPDGDDADGVVTITTTNGSDAEAGLDPTSAVLERQLAPFSGGACGAFGSWEPVTSPDTVPAGNCAKYRYRVSDNVGNEAIYTSASIVLPGALDPTPPSSPALSLAEAPASPFEHVEDTTVYYNPSGTNSGSFTVDASTSDAESGVSRVDFPEVFALDGSSVTAPPYQKTYSWTPLASASGLRTVTAVNGSGLTASTTFTVTPDTAAPSLSLVEPTPGAVVRNGQTLSASSADALAGVAGVEFAYCPGSVCSWILATPIGTDSSPPYSLAWDTQPTDGSYTILARARDNVGNEVVSAGTAVVVDNTIPTGSLSLAEGARPDLQHFDGAASVLYYNPAAPGDFRLLEAASDDLGGVQRVDFPAITTAGFSGAASSDAVAPYESSVYTFDGLNASAPDPAAVVVSDAAGNTTVDTITFVRDTEAPAGGSVSYADGFDADASVEVSTANGADPAGIDGASALLERQTAALANGSCGSFGSWSAVSSPDDLPSASCARYRLRVSDRVGNEAAFTSASVVKVDLSAPAEPVLTVTESEPDEHLIGDTLYYNPSGSNAGTFSVEATSSDPESAMSGVAFPVLFGADSATDAVAPYSHSYSWTSAASAGTDVTVSAVNGAGLTATSTFTVTPDTAGPDVSILTPADAAIRNGQTLAAAAFDALAGAAGVEFRYCSGTSCDWATATLLGNDSSAPFELAWNAQPTDGAYTVLARALDNVGNATEASPVTVLVDNTAPVAAQNNPGTPLEGDVVVEATASDATSGIATAEFQVSPGGLETWTTIETDSTSSYSVVWDTLTVNDGRYDLRVIATDRAGNAAASAIVRNRQVTNHPPVVSITAPDAFYVTGSDPDPFPLEATSPSPDLRHVEFFSCSDASLDCSTGTWIGLGLDNEAPYAATWPVDPDGNRALKAVVTNLSWSQGTDVNNIRIDRSGPTGGSIAYADGYDADGSITLTTADGSDGGSGVDTSSGVTERQTAPLADGVCGSFGAWTGAPLNPDTVPDATCARYRYHVLDEAGNRATYSSAATVMVDLTAPPAPTLELDESEADQHVDGATFFYNPSAANSGSFTVTASATDPESGVGAVEFPLVYGADDQSDSSQPFEATYSWTSSSAAAGEFAVTVHNAAGLTAEASFVVALDVDPPSVALSTPSAGASIREGQALAATATDALSGPREVEFRYCPGAGCEWAFATSIATDTSAPYGVDWTGQPADGDYTLLARSVDNVGNESTVETRSVVIDNTAPAVAFSEPGAYVNSGAADPVVVTATSADPIAAIEILRCDNASSDCSSGSWVSLGSSAVAPLSVSSSEADGNRAFRTVVQDVAGNSGSSVLNVIVDRTAPAGPALTSSHTPGTSSADDTVDIAFASAADSGSGLAGFSYHWDADFAGAPDTVMDADETAAGVTSPTLADGTWYFHVRSADRAGNWGETAHAGPFLIDTSPPISASSIPSFGPLTAVQLAKSFVVSWSAAEAVAYDVRYRAAGTNGIFGVHTTWLTGTSALSASFIGSPGWTYCLSARGLDAAGLASDWSSETCTSVPLNNTSLTHSRSWAKKTGSGYYLGSYSISSQRGASLTRTGVGARRIALVATKCPTCGTVGIYWKRTLLKKVNLASSTTRKKRLIQLPLFASLRQGTVKLVVLSSGRPVRIEGLATSPQ